MDTVDCVWMLTFKKRHKTTWFHPSSFSSFAPLPKGPSVITDICEKAKARHFFSPPPSKGTCMFYIQDRYFLEMRFIHIHACKCMHSLQWLVSIMVSIEWSQDTSYMYRQCENKHGAHMYMCVEYTSSTLHEETTPKFIGRSQDKKHKCLSVAHQNLTKVLRIEGWQRCWASRLDETAVRSVPAVHGCI